MDGAGPIPTDPGRAAPAAAADRLLDRHPWVPRRLFDVAEYRRMGELGLLGEDERVELIEGELVQMAAVGSPHMGAVMALTRLLVLAAGVRALLAVQDPIRLGDRSEPEPDLALLRPRSDGYRLAKPVPAEVLLLVEVADSSLRYDRLVKLPLYARHGIAVAWLVDLDGRAWRSTASRGRRATRASRARSRGRRWTCPASPARGWPCPTSSAPRPTRLRRTRPRRPPPLTDDAAAGAR